MSVFDHLKKDDSFLRRITNVFLIRDPRQAIASHFAKNPDVTCEEIGYEEQASIFRQVWDLTDKQPLVCEGLFALLKTYHQIKVVGMATSGHKVIQCLLWHPASMLHFCQGEVS